MDDNLDKENYLKESNMEETGRIVVKLILPKMPEVDAAAEIVPAEEKKIHYCKECDKSFSSGKALGGHTSSAHVQANKDQPLKKLKSRIKKHRKDGDPTAENICTICGKDFRSKKSLFGHMRCHPERVWRGMQPPPEEQIGSPPEDSLEQDLEDDDPIEAVAELDLSLNWAMRAKRGGRGTAVKPRPRNGPTSDNELSVAHQLMKLFKDIPMEKVVEKEDDKYSWAHNGPELENMDRAFVSKKQKRDVSGPDQEWACESIKKLKIRDCKSVPKLKICEREDNSDGAHCRRKIGINDNGKGKETMDCEGKLKGKLQGQPHEKKSPITSSSSSLSRSFSDGIDSDDEIYLTAINDLINQKQEANCRTRAKKKEVVVEEKTVLPSKTRAGEGKMGTSSSSSPKKYYCEKCNKSYPTHQAFGGHKSSHNKFKITIVNSDDTNGKIKNARKKGNFGNEKCGSPSEDMCKKFNKGFSSGKALGGHKRSHADDEKKKSSADLTTHAVKVVLDFDLNKEPVEEDGIGEDGVIKYKDAAEDSSSSHKD